MKPENQYFKYAHEAWCGDPYEWYDDEGNYLSPITSGDEKLKAFYQGFLFAKKGHNDLLQRIKVLKSIKQELKECEKYYNEFFQK